MKNKNCGIYRIINIQTGDCYIGQSINLLKRKYLHFDRLNKNAHINKYLQHAFNKYGKESFEFRVILYCEDFELTRYEQNSVDIFHPAYNLRKECVTSNRGLTCSEETRKKMSDSHKGFIFTDEHRLKLGYVKTEEHRRKISETLNGHIISEEQRRKLSKAGMGHAVSEKTILLLKERMQNKEITKKISKTLMGHPVSEETRLKLSQKVRAYWEQKKKSELLMEI